MRGRKIFNGAGALQPDNTIWRAGANEATALHTDADLDIGGLAVPKGITPCSSGSIPSSGSS